MPWWDSRAALEGQQTGLWSAVRPGGGGTAVHWLEPEAESGVEGGMGGAGPARGGRRWPGAGAPSAPGEGGETARPPCTLSREAPSSEATGLWTPSPSPPAFKGRLRPRLGEGKASFTGPGGVCVPFPHEFSVGPPGWGSALEGPVGWRCREPPAHCTGPSQSLGSDWEASVCRRENSWREETRRLARSSF